MSTTSEDIKVQRRRPKCVISYVRNEAKNHAIRLKTELEECNFDVFLDIDYIRGGDDWVDVLNYAVLDCDLFIPLITSKYGYTKWTNREVKLADRLDKQIIPISFLDNWPPDCLAILLNSIHYIAWNNIDNHSEQTEAQHGTDTRFWDQQSIRSAAVAIADKFNKNWSVTGHPLHSDNSDETNPFQSTSSLSGIKLRLEIVVSAHPSQKELVELIRNSLLKTKFKVWSSTDISIDGLYASNHKQVIQTVGGQTSNLSAQDFETNRCFKDKVSAASLVIIVLSESYCKSKTCRRQLFYCNYTKKLVVIKLSMLQLEQCFFDDNQNILFDDNDALEYTPNNSDSFAVQLNQKVSKQIDSEDNITAILSSFNKKKIQK